MDITSLINSITSGNGVSVPYIITKPDGTKTTYSGIPIDLKIGIDKEMKDLITESVITLSLSIGGGILLGNVLSGFIQR